MEDIASLRAKAEHAERLADCLTTAHHRENILEVARSLRDQADALEATAALLAASPSEG